MALSGIDLSFGSAGAGASRVGAHIGLSCVAVPWHNLSHGLCNLPLDGADALHEMLGVHKTHANIQRRRLRNEVQEALSASLKPCSLAFHKSFLFHGSLYPPLGSGNTLLKIQLEVQQLGVCRGRDTRAQVQSLGLERQAPGFEAVQLSVYRPNVTHVGVVLGPHR